jgi:hypothetical protein
VKRFDPAEEHFLPAGRVDVAIQHQLADLPEAVEASSGRIGFVRALLGFRARLRRFPFGLLGLGAYDQPQDGSEKADDVKSRRHGKQPRIDESA